MDYITVSAKTLDDAITEALIQLGVTSDQLDYEVIEKGSPGFLGIGMKQAVIKARRKHEEPEVSELDELLKEEVKEETAKETEKEEKEPQKTADKPVREKKHKNKKKHEPKHEPEKAAEEKAEEVRKEIELAKVEDQTIEACEKFISDVMKAMNMENVKVTSSIDEEGALSINMEGPNMGILIGKRGQTLDSLQYLTNRVVNKGRQGYIRVKLDTEDYRNRRKETLENLARSIAYKVRKTRRPVSLEPMNPYERRIIHSALQGNRFVETYSEGNEPYRHVVVKLKNR